MEYTNKELDDRIDLCQKNIKELSKQKSRISRVLSDEKQKLGFWEEIKKSQQEKLF